MDTGKDDNLISRRNFLKMAGITAGGVALGEARKKWGSLFTTLSDERVQKDILANSINLSLEQLGTERGRLALEADAWAANLASNDIIRNDSREFDRKEFVNRNPNLRPIDEIVSEGIKLYEEAGGRPQYGSVYSPDPRLYLPDIQKAVSSVVLGTTNMGDLVTQRDRLEAEIVKDNPLLENIISFSRYNMRSFKDYAIIYPIGGLWKRFAEANEDVDSYLESARTKIEDLFSSKLSVSRLLKHFLYQNDGRIEDSLWDVAIMLKIFCRNEPQTGIFVGYLDENRQKRILGIMTCRFSDEYSLSGHDYLTESSILDAWGRSNGPIKYNDTNVELSPLNRSGVLYHAWNDVALLTVFPAEFVISGIIAQQGMTLGEQGFAKLGADLYVASRLKKVENILNRYK